MGLDPKGRRSCRISQRTAGRRQAPQEAPLLVLRDRARAKGMRLLLDEAIAKVDEGVTTLRELQRAISPRLLDSRSVVPT